MNEPQRHRDAERVPEGLHAGLTSVVIGAAIDVHKALGPGLLESAYEECLCYEFSTHGMSFKRQVPLPAVCKGVKLDCGYRMDVVVEGMIVLELKCVEHLLPIHEAQRMTYLCLSQHEVGLLLNFGEAVLRDGIVRKVLRRH